MPFSILHLCKKSLGLIKQDPFLLVPYLVFFLSNQIFHQLFPHFLKQNNTILMLEVMVLTWIIELFFKSLTLLLAGSVYRGHPFSLKKTLYISFQRFLILLIGTGPFIIPIMISTQVFYKTPPTQVDISMISLLIFTLVLIPVSLILEMVPLPILLEKKAYFQGIKEAYRFVKTEFRKVLLVTSLTLCIIIICSLLSLWVTTPSLTTNDNFAPLLSALGNSLESIIQAFGYCFIYCILTVFYLDIKTQKLNETKSSDSPSFPDPNSI